MNQSTWEFKARRLRDLIAGEAEAMLESFDGHKFDYTEGQLDDCVNLVYVLASLTSEYDHLERAVFLSPQEEKSLPDDVVSLNRRRKVVDSLNDTIGKEIRDVHRVIIDSAIKTGDTDKIKQAIQNCPCTVGRAMGYDRAWQAGYLLFGRPQS